MPAPRSAPRRASRAHSSPTYWDASRQPLQILAFLLPLILFYEVSVPHLISSQGQDVKAHRGIVQFFQSFGFTAGALFIGGVVIIVVLLLWHTLERKPWKFSLPFCAFMAAESLLLILPLLVLGRFIGDAQLLAFAPAYLPGAEFAHWSPWERITLSIGAGLYEELIFRMLLIAVIHTLIVDVAKASHAVGASIGVLISALAFTFYHPLTDLAGAFLFNKAVFLFLAGLYFGAIYSLRGFGIVVAVHALYDTFTFFLLPSTP